MHRTDAKLLIAVDGSEAALRACEIVAGYAGDRSRIEVTLLNVQRPPVRAWVEPGVEQAVLDKALRDEGLHKLERGLGVLRNAGLAGRGLVALGAPAETLLQWVRDNSTDLLVMGSGRHGMLGGYAMGSVALRVAPAAQCPVLLVPPNARFAAKPATRMRVTAPVDGSDASARAIHRLAGWAPLLGALHVDLVHFSTGLTLAGAVLPPHDDVMAQWRGDESRAALQTPSEVLSAAGIPCSLHSLTGEAGTGIVGFARETSADLIAMGTRGMGAMHHFVLGSVALTVAQRSDVPVALLR